MFDIDGGKIGDRVPEADVAAEGEIEVDEGGGKPSGPGPDREMIEGGLVEGRPAGIELLVLGRGGCDLLLIIVSAFPG